MARFIKDRSASKGQVPGSLILIGKQKMEQPVIQLMDIRSDTLEERELESVAKMAPYKESDSVSWIDI
jgi:magnesium transporter